MTEVKNLQNQVSSENIAPRVSGERRMRERDPNKSLNENIVLGNCTENKHLLELSHGIISRSNGKRRSAKGTIPTKKKKLSEERDLATSSVSRRTSPTREFMNQLCEEPIATQSSGGFQMFLRSLGDEEAFKISADVSKFHVVSCKNNENGTPEVLTLLAVLRHHYNSFDVAARRKYESEARLLVKDVNEHSQSETDEPEDAPLFNNDVDMESENDESCCKYEEVGYISKTAPKMIISEFPYSSDKMIRLNRIHQGNLTDRMICAQCCLNPGDVPVITKIENPSHLLSHRSAHLYGCHFCRTAYPDANQLKKHQCLPFAEFLATKLLTREVEMLSSRIVLACSDCGAYVPWRPNSKNKVKNGWKKFMKTHNPEHILPIVVFFAVEDVENDMTIEIKYIPTHTRETVLSCSRCRIAMFSSPLDAEKHFADRSLHPDKDLHRCKHCQKTFALESFYKEHLLQCIFTEDSHQDGNPLLADWLTHCANILSPAGRVSGTKEIAVYGGSQVPPNCDKNKMVSKVECCAVARRHNAALRKARGKMLASDIDEEKTKWDDHSKARSLLQKLAPESSSGLTMSLENFLNTDGEDLKGEDLENVSFSRPVEPPIISSMFCRFEKSVKIRLGEGCSYSEACGHEKIHLCQRCNHFVRDDSALLSHLNQCAPLSDGLQHDIDDRTMSFPVGFGGIVINRLYCPKCSESSCSIGALRTHLATIHGIWTGSLLNRDVARRPPRIQNVVSLRTNLALGLDETGKLPLLKKSGDDQLSLSAERNRGGEHPTVESIPAPIFVNQAPASIRHRLSQQTIAKKTIDATSCWRESREEEDAEDSPLNDHTQGPINKVSDQVKNCSTILRGTTQTPSHSDVPSVSGVVQSSSRSSSSSNSLVNTHPKKPYRASQSQIPCLICHGLFPSARALSNHHRKHLEKPLKRCFLCPSAESHAATFQTLEQLLHHLQTHVIETVTPTLDKLRLCWFCREKTTVFHLPGHLMYQCTKLPCCIWCGFEAATRQELQQHTNSVHFSNFTRLLCTHCPTIFHSLKLARDHRCPPNAMEPAFFRCECNRPQIYISSVEYSKHFNLCHRVDGKCAICFLSTSEDHNQSHAHQRALGKAEDGLRRIVVMDMEMMDEEIHYDKDDWIGLEELDCLHPPPDYAASRPRIPSILLAGSTNCPSPSPVPENIVPPESVICLEPPVENDEDEARFAAPPPSVMIIENQEFVQRANERTEEQSTSSPDDLDLTQPPPSVVCLEPTQENSPNTLDITLTAPVREESGNDSPAATGNYAIEDDGEDDVVIIEDLAQQNGLKVTKKDDNEDDLMVVSQPEATIAENVVSINEGDDDLMTEAIVRHAAGTTSANVKAGREKKHKCTLCSEKFFTDRSLKEHMKSHPADAGAALTTCEGMYGLPITSCPFFLCRLCCIAYSDFDKWKNHMSGHGKTSHQYVCPRCPQISFNQRSAMQHWQFHEQNSPNYMCTICEVVFSSDLELQQHGEQTHKMKLLYFCKKCGFASLERVSLYGHIISCDFAGVEIYPPELKDKFTPEMCFGAVSSHLLHFQPLDEEEWIKNQRSPNDAVKTVAASDCSHRSFLAFNYPTILCPINSCAGWVSSTAFLGIDESERSKIEKLMGQTKLIVKPNLFEKAQVEYSRYNATRQPAQPPVPTRPPQGVQNQMPWMVPPGYQFENGDMQVVRVLPDSTNKKRPGIGIRGPNGARLLPGNAQVIQSQNQRQFAVPTSRTQSQSQLQQLLSRQNNAPAAPPHHQGQGISHQNPTIVVRQSTSHIIGPASASSTVVPPAARPGVQPAGQRPVMMNQQNRQIQSARHQMNSDALARQQRLLAEQEETRARNRAERISLDFSICGMKQLTVLAQMRCCVCGQFRIESELRIVPSMPEIREHWMRIVFDAMASSLYPSHLELFRKKLGLKFAALGTDCYICTRHLKRLDANRDIPCVISQDVFMDHATTCFFCDMKKDRAQLVSLTTNMNMRSQILDKLAQGSLNPDGTQRTKTEIARRLLYSISEQICSAHFPGTSVNSNVAVGLPFPAGKIPDTARRPLDQQPRLSSAQMPGPSGVIVQMQSPSRSNSMEMGRQQAIQGNVVNAQSNQHGYFQQTQRLQMNAHQYQQQQQVPYNDRRAQTSYQVVHPESRQVAALKINPPVQCNFAHCKKEMTRVPIVKFHQMLHNSTNRFFCLDCLVTVQTEQDMVLHVTESHLQNREPVWDIACPVPNCNETGMSLLAAKRHLKTHGAELPFRNECCSTVFHTPVANGTHEQRHERANTDTCCLLCGQVDYWNFMHQGTRLSHMMVHAIRRYMRCRICGDQTRGANPEYYLVQHFMASHAMNTNGPNSICRPCNREIGPGPEAMRSHILQDHSVFAFTLAHPDEEEEANYAPVRSKPDPNSLTIRAGRQMCDYLGIPWAYKCGPKRASDSCEYDPCL